MQFKQEIGFSEILVRSTASVDWGKLIESKTWFFFRFHTSVDTELFTLYLKVALILFLMMPLFHIIKSVIYLLNPHAQNK